jgi:hypothetical protein
MAAFDEATVAHLHRLKSGLVPKAEVADEPPPRRLPESNAPDSWESKSTLHATCLRLFEENNQSTPAAAAALVRLAKAEPEVCEELMRGAMEERALAAMRHVGNFIGRKAPEIRLYRDGHHNNTGTRSTVRPPSPQPRPTLSRKSMQAWADEVEAGLLETFQLPDGTYLKDADRDGLLSASAFYREQSQELRTQAKWLELIAQGLPPGARVGGKLTNARVAELQDIAREGDDDED